ncbi:MAG: hypothetical protein R2748_02080 [Bryobacterales bacterium]
MLGRNSAVSFAAWHERDAVGWTSAVDFIRYNLRQEIFNLTLGVEYS